MTNTESIRILGEFLMGKKILDSEVYEAIRVQYLNASKTEKENKAA